MEYDGWLHINLYHAIDKDVPDKFTPRGNVTISSLNSGSFTIVQEPLSSSERIKLKVNVIHETSSTDAYFNFQQKLAETDSIYRLKAVVYGQDRQEFNFLTYSRAVRD